MIPCLGGELSLFFFSFFFPSIFASYLFLNLKRDSESAFQYGLVRLDQGECELFMWFLHGLIMFYLPFIFMPSFPKGG